MKKCDYQSETCDVYCDNCDNDITIDDMNYYYVNQQLKEKGWITKKVNGKFVDFCCKDCYLKYLNKRR